MYSSLEKSLINKNICTLLLVYKYQYPGMTCKLLYLKNYKYVLQYASDSFYFSATFVPNSSN